MKYQLFSYSAPDKVKTGIAVRDVLFDLDAVATSHRQPTVVGRTIDQLLETWSSSHTSLKLIASAIAASDSGSRAAEVDRASIRFEAPLSRPGVIYAAGANYLDHVEAMGRAFNMKLVTDPKGEGIDPWHFIKAGRGTLVGSGHDITFPPHTEKLDWEAELAVVIGKKASHVSKEEALDFVAGYSCANDISARDNLVRQKVDPTSPFRFDWIGHKCFTGGCPLGPFLTPSEFVGSPESLDIRLWINDELKQDSNTNNHLYGVAEQIAFLSGRLDLYPGDVILTGTPAGVGMESGVFLKRGDVMRVWIDGLGELSNRIV